MNCGLSRLMRGGVGTLSGYGHIKIVKSLFGIEIFPGKCHEQTCCFRIIET